MTTKGNEGGDTAGQSVVDCCLNTDASHDVEPHQDMVRNYHFCGTLPACVHPMDDTCLAVECFGANDRDGYLDFRDVG